MAAFSAPGLIILSSTAEGTSAPGGNVSTVKSSTELPFQRAAATRSGANSMARCGCGIASSHRDSRVTSPVSVVPWRRGEMLLNESPLIDLFQGRDARADFCQAALAQCDHAFLARSAFDLRGGPAIDNHFADAVAQVQEFADGCAAVESGTGTFEAPGAFHQRYVRPDCRVETAFG